MNGGKHNCLVWRQDLMPQTRRSGSIDADKRASLQYGPKDSSQHHDTEPKWPYLPLPRPLRPQSTRL